MKSAAVICVTIVCLIVLLAPSSLPAQKLPRPLGVDCGCSLTGGYVLPDSGVNISVSNDAASPHHKFTVSVAGTDPIELTVTRSSDHSTVFSQSVSAGTYWGFSPDDDRFVTNTTLGSTNPVTLYDLSGSTAVQIWSSSVATLSSRIVFSAHGNYLFYTAITEAFYAIIDIVDAHTGASAYQASYTFANIPDTSDQYGMSTHGFSPDSSDRTFVWAYAYDQNSTTWTMVNLERRTTLLSELHPEIAGYWEFSPCGDVIAIVDQTGINTIDVRLLKTLNGSSASGGSRSYPVAATTFRSTSASQIVTNNGTDYILGSNTADGACIIAPDTLILQRHTVRGGTIDSAALTLTAPAAGGGLTVTLASSAPSAASVPASILVPEGAYQATFPVTTLSVAETTVAVISASAAGITKRDTLTITPHGVQSVMVNPVGLFGGDSAQCTVTLTDPAGAGGEKVTLTNSNSAISTIPTNVTVPQNSTQYSFTVNTSPVAKLDSTIITATAGSTSASATLLIAPFATVAFQPDTVVGGNPSSFTATLVIPAKFTYQPIYFSTSDSATAWASSPLAVPGGYLQYGTPVLTHGVAADTSVTFTVHNSPTPVSAKLLLTPANLESVTALPDDGCLVGKHGSQENNFIAGYPILFDVELDGESPPGGASIAVTTDQPSILPPGAPVVLSPQTRGMKWALTSNDVLASPQRVIVSLTYRSRTVKDTVMIYPHLHYKLVEFGDSLGYTTLGIASDGTVLATGPAGYYFWKNGQTTPLSSFPGFHLDLTYAVNPMNDSGHLAGTSNGHAAYWKPDTTIILPEPAGYNSSYGIAMNIHDDVVGVADSAGDLGLGTGCLWQNGVASTLDGYGPYTNPVPQSINSSRQIAGYVWRYHYLYTTLYAAVLWENNHITWSLPDTVDYPSANVINDSGFLAGSFNSSPDAPESDWFTRSGGDTLVYQTLPPYFGTYPRGMNSRGDIVGEMWYGDAGTSPFGFVFIDGLYYDLNCLTDSIPPAQYLASAGWINNAGTIAGTVRYGRYNSTQACVLIPTGATLGVITSPKGRMPSSYALRQNYPNPFNPSTIISYSLPKESRVTLTVYDLLGRTVAILADGMQTPGEKSVRFDASRLSSGVYFYRLRAGAYESVKKMLLAK